MGHAGPAEPAQVKAQAARAAKEDGGRLCLEPAFGGDIRIRQPLPYGAWVARNRLWYRGEAAELHQFFRQMDDGAGNTLFWQARASEGIPFRKIHTGLPALMVDVLSEIVARDLIGVVVQALPSEGNMRGCSRSERTVPGEGDNTGAFCPVSRSETPLTLYNGEGNMRGCSRSEQPDAQARWDSIAAENDFGRLLKTALREAMVAGDGAFKICVDPEAAEGPIVEFYAGERVEYGFARGRLREVVFLSEYADPEKPGKRLTLREHYGKNGVAYRLTDEAGAARSLGSLAELRGLADTENPQGFLMAVPLVPDASAVWPGRGKSLFDGKSGAFDAFDEVFSQWMDSLRDSRTVRYIPEDLTPRNPANGRLLAPNAFDNRYLTTGADRSEGARNQIEVKSGEIPHEALLASYTTALDLCLQGVISPSTLGIDVKKLDNAEAQREKEKATLYTRNKLVGALEETLPRLAQTVLQVDDMLHGRAPGAYRASASFGEYANPSFEAQVETVGKARSLGVMSAERAVEELYGGSLTREERAEEAARIEEDGTGEHT